MSEDNHELWEKAIFGKQVDEFLSSQIGQFLIKKAQNDWQIAVQCLRECESKDLLKFQSDMKRAESIQGWLIEAVEEGLRALNLIQENEE